MKVYIALYESNGQVLVGKKRGMNNWRDGQMKPFAFTDGEAGEFCLPGGERNHDETYHKTAARVYEELTGYPLPSFYQWTKVFERPRYVLVCCRVINMRFFQVDINMGLAPRPSNSAAPTNGKVVNWELERVWGVPRKDLDKYLGCPQNVKDLAARALAGKDLGAAYGSDGARMNSVHLFHGMAELLKTLA